MFTRTVWCSLAFLSVTGLALPAAAVVQIEWVTVGDPRNASDPNSGGCWGSVSAVFRISKFEITNQQYAEFLNAVAATDLHDLYNPDMGLPAAPIYGGIARSGVAGSFGYAAIAGRENMPVNFVSFWNALRFANWLHNGQPTGPQDDTTTEAGAYAITAQGIADNSITRNTDATIAIPTEHEWFKAAYYDPVTQQYFDFPGGTDTETVCSTAGSTPNTGNCDDAVGDFTDVGNYAASASPNGTFDQGGNIAEWNETVRALTFRGTRGGCQRCVPFANGAASRAGLNPSAAIDHLGFRVASPGIANERLVRFEWSGVISSDGTEVLTNPNVAPGESWTLVHEFDSALPDQADSCGTGFWIEPTRTATIHFEGGYSSPVSMTTSLNVRVSVGSIFLVHLEAPDFYAIVVQTPGSSATDAFPEGPYEQTPFSTGATIFSLVNADGEISYRHDTGSVAVNVTLITAVPASSSSTRVWMVLALLVVSAGGWSFRRRV